MIELQPITETFVAEITDLDIRQLSAADFDAIYTAWLQFGVLRLRDQPVDAAHTSTGELRGGFDAFDDPRDAPGAVHPMVLRHDETGSQALYLGRREWAYIPGLPLDESEALLDEIWSIAVRPEFVWQQQWHPGDLIIWDNRRVLHRRDDFDQQSRRLMKRCQVLARTAYRTGAPSGGRQPVHTHPLVHHSLPERGSRTTYHYLSVARDGNVVTCTLSNPPHHTLTARGVFELFQVLNNVEADPSVRALVFTGAGEGVFIAHYEVGELSDTAEHNIGGASTAEDPKASEPELSEMHQLCLRLERMSAITIAAMNGNTAGGGFELSLACDFRLLADGRYRVGLPETSIGIIPGAGGTQRYARLLGTARALDLILHAKLLTPAEALELGLVHRVYPEDRFREEAAAFAADIASRAPIALAAAKYAIQQGSRMPLDESLLLEQRCFVRTMRSKDAAGAMRAYLGGSGKTPYDWQGE